MANIIETIREARLRISREKTEEDVAMTKSQWITKDRKTKTEVGRCYMKGHEGEASKEGRCTRDQRTWRMKS